MKRKGRKESSLKGAALGLGPGLMVEEMSEELAEDTMTVPRLLCCPNAPCWLGAGPGAGAGAGAGPCERGKGVKMSCWPMKMEGCEGGC